jgi:hypothetical protein
MSKQLHKNFIDEQVKLLLKSYVDKEIKIDYILSILGIKRSRFFELLAKYRKEKILITFLSNMTEERLIEK